MTISKELMNISVGINFAHLMHAVGCVGAVLLQVLECSTHLLAFLLGSAAAVPQGCGRSQQAA